MTDIIGKTIDEIRDQSPDLDELSDRQLCYVVALGMGEIKETFCRSLYNKRYNEVFEVPNGVSKFQWPDYTTSGEHAWRVLEVLPARVYPQGPSIEVKPLPADLCEFYIEGPDLKYAATKAAAKCVLEGVALEVSG